MSAGEWIMLIMGSSLGVSLLVLLYIKLGKYVKKTENKIDDKIYEMFPETVDFLVDNLDLGEAEKILDDFLERLDSIDADTTELEDIIKTKKDDIKK